MPASSSATVITGASSGIGKCLAQQLAASEKQPLILVARRREQLEALANELRQAHSLTVEVIAMDLEQAGSAQKLLQIISEKGFTVGTLINNAGYGINNAFAETPLDKVQGMMQLNMATLTELCHAVLPSMRAQQSGRILNVASLAAFMACPNFAVYAATKSYVLSFSEALANEERPHGIHVTALCPGSTRTAFHDVAGTHGSFVASIMDPPEQVAASGIAALNASRAVEVTGWLNKPVPFLMRFAPRTMITWMAGKLVAREK